MSGAATARIRPLDHETVDADLGGGAGFLGRRDAREHGRAHRLQGGDVLGEGQREGEGDDGNGLRVSSSSFSSKESSSVRAPAPG